MYCREMTLNLSADEVLTTTRSVRKRLDFDKPITIRVNNVILWNRRRIAANPGTLLEDFYERGDRQRLCLARVDFDRHPPQLQWLVDPRTARSIYASVGKSSRPKTSRK